MILIFDKSQNFITEIGKDAIIGAQQDLALNGLWQASVVLPFDEWEAVKDHALYFGYKDEWDQFYLYKITKTKAQAKQVTLEGVHIFFDELQGRIIKDKRPKNASAQALADMVLDGTGWQAIATASGGRSLNFYYTSAAKAFEEIIKAFGADYSLDITLSGGKIAEKTVTIADSISRDYGKWYEYGDELLDVIEEQDRKSVFTAVIGRGKGIESKDGNGDATGGYGRKLTFADVSWSRSNGDPVDKPPGQEYVEIREATAALGYPGGSPRIGVKEFSSIEDPEELLRETYKYAKQISHPYLLLKATAIPTQAIDLGEIVTIIRPDMGIRYKTKVIRIKTDLLTNVKEITIGDQSQVSVVQAITDITDSQKADKLEVGTWISKVQKALMHDMFNEDGYTYNLKAGNEYNLPAGIYSFNKPIDKNPTKVIYVGAGKFAIADHKGSDGQWEFHTFGDGSGFTADLIRAGILQGGGVKWNLETGYLNIGDKLIYDPSTGELHLAQGSVTINALDEETKGKINQAIELSGAITDTATEYAMGGCGNAAPMDGWSEDALLTMADKNDGVNLPYNGDVALITMRQEKMRAIKKDGSFSDSSFSLEELLPDRFYVYVDQLPTTLSGFESSIPTYYTGSSSPVETLKRFYIEHYTDGGFQKLFKTGCLWKRTVYKCSDGTVKYSPAERVGKDGKRAYVHIAYADDNKGGGFSFDDSDKAYMGQYTDQEEETSTDATRYKWTRIRGKDGTDGNNGTNGRGVKTVITQYAVAYSDETPSGASWTDTPPSYWSEYAKVWQRLKVIYTDGGVGYTTPEKFNDEALKSLKEKMNTIESGYTEIKDGQARFVTKSALGAVGETSINGFNITTGGIRSQTGDTYIDLNGSNFTFGRGAMTYSPSDGLRIGGSRYYMTSDNRCFAIHSTEWRNGRLGGFRATTDDQNRTNGVMLYSSQNFNMRFSTQADQGDSSYTHHIILKHNNTDGGWTEIWQDMLIKGCSVYTVGAGTIQATSVTSSSDLRLKKDVKPWDVKALDVINATDFIRFRWKDGDDEAEHYGVSAQSIPMAQVKKSDGYLAVDGYTMSAINGKAIQELSSKVEQLERQNKGLQMRIKRLEEAIHDIIGRS